jgi:hypothetical protein
LAFSYWIDYLGFITEGKLAAVLITPSLGVPNWSVIYMINTAPSSGYNCWTKHGERGVMMEDNDEEENDVNYPVYPKTTNTAMADNEEEEGEERASDMPADDLGQVIADAQIGQKKLGTTLELLQWKAETGLSDKGFEKLLKIVKKMLPKDKELPASTYEAKNIVCPLGLEVQKIHACPND